MLEYLSLVPIKEWWRAVFSRRTSSLENEYQTNRGCDKNNNTKLHHECNTKKIQNMGPVWTVGLEGGLMRVNHASVVIDNRIYSFGGYCTGDDYSMYRPIDVHVLNLTTYRWRQLPVKMVSQASVPFMRYGHTVVADGHIAYLWGGRNDMGGCNQLFAFDTHTSRWCQVETLGSVPGPRDGHSACLIGRRMYVFGGFEELVDRFSQDVYYLDLETMRWHYVNTKGTPPTWRDFHTASVIGERMYVFGGRGDVQGPFHSQHETYCNRLSYLDTKRDEWVHPETFGEKPVGRRSHSAFVYRDQLYIFGGYNGVARKHYGKIYKYSPKKRWWSQVTCGGRCPCPRRRACCCVVGDRVFLFGGTSPQHPGAESLSPVTPHYNAHHIDDASLVDHSDLFVLDFSPSLRTLCILAVLNNKLDVSSLPKDVIWDIQMMTTDNQITRPIHTNG